MSDFPLWQLSAAQLAALLEDGTSTASAVLHAVHERLAEVNELLNAVVTLNPNAAAGVAINARDFATVIETLEAFRAQVAIAFRDFDLLVTPTTAALPWPAAQAFPQTIDGQAVGPRGHAIFSGWVNACGHPAITLPCEPSAGGLPIGMQLVAKFARDDLLLDVAQDYEAAAPWAQRWPNLTT